MTGEAAPLPLPLLLLRLGVVFLTSSFSGLSLAKSWPVVSRLGLSLVDAGTHRMSLASLAPLVVCVSFVESGAIQGFVAPDDVNGRKLQPAKNLSAMTNLLGEFKRGMKKMNGQARNSMPDLSLDDSTSFAGIWSDWREPEVPCIPLPTVTPKVAEAACLGGGRGGGGGGRVRRRISRVELPGYREQERACRTKVGTKSKDVNSNKCAGEAMRVHSCTLTCVNYWRLVGVTLFGIWSEWGPWRCDEECEDHTVLAKRERTCIQKVENYWCRGSAPKQEKSCRNGNEVRCTKSWSEWGSTWKGCQKACDLYYYQERRCEGIGRDCECHGHPTNEWRQCGRKLGIPCPRKFVCRPRDGAWGEWSRDWSACSRTCGRGRGWRYRVRSCDNPSPLMDGKPCEGPRIDYDSTPCYAGGVPCPVPGDWCQWSGWQCPQCGEVATRGRECQCPEPEDGGENCAGESQESNRTCHNECDQVPEIPPDLRKRIEENLRRGKNDADLKRNEGDRVEMDCQSDLLEPLMKAFPENDGIVWTHRGKPLRQTLKAEASRNQKRHRFSASREILRIDGVHLDDAGIFVCKFKYSKLSTRAVAAISFFALTVETSRVSLVARAGEDVELPCRAEEIFRLLGDGEKSGVKMLQIWTHNGTSARTCEGINCNDNLKLEAIRRMDAGVWECRLEETRKGRNINSWRTNFLRVAVGPGRAFWMEILDRPLLLSVVVVVKVVVVVFACVSMSSKLKNEEEKRKAKILEFQRWKEEIG